MTLGSNISHWRKERKLSQEKLAEKVGVSFQAISAWERDEYKPEMENLMKLAYELDVSVSVLAREKEFLVAPEKEIFKWENMKTFIKTTAKNYGMENTLKALDFAIMAHDGQVRKNSNIPYVSHPIHLACHALAMGLRDDELIAGCLLHDVVEDTPYTLEDLPVNDNVRRLVALMSKPKPYSDRNEMMEKYMTGLKSEPKAALIKCLDRCNNLTTMTWGLKRKKIYRNINETDLYILPLLDVIKQVPEYNDAYWLLKYHISSMVDIYKRLL